MGEYFRQMWGGPGHLRVFLQPAAAILLGILDGLEDVRQGRPPYLRSLAMGRGERAERLKELVTRLAVPLALGVGLSIVFQLIIRRSVIWAAAIGAGAVLIALPYVFARTATARWARRSRRQLRA